ncbi:hypothetical protein T265_09947 [Opisthorchis viverrini]|uniref:Uncharacterized protein n=1 Tax=Opisthorchis viverrini TaxID=6198 RepID=A0A074Z3Z8_OPIVI|nr:hypothetical protein T265_09947 [Opisthorchis viverrini]KER21811.1 hypothetical protein T265_09947 [Opisthorchis viverrini]
MVGRVILGLSALKSQQDTGPVVLPSTPSTRGTTRYGIPVWPLPTPPGLCITNEGIPGLKNNKHYARYYIGFAYPENPSANAQHPADHRTEHFSLTTSITTSVKGLPRNRRLGSMGEAASAVLPFISQHRSQDTTKSTNPLLISGQWAPDRNSCQYHERMSITIEYRKCRREWKASATKETTTTQFTRGYWRFGQYPCQMHKLAHIQLAISSHQLIVKCKMHTPDELVGQQPLARHSVQFRQGPIRRLLCAGKELRRVSCRFQGYFSDVVPEDEGDAVCLLLIDKVSTSNNLNTGELQISSLYDVFKGWFLESSPHILTVPEGYFSDVVPEDEGDAVCLLLIDKVSTSNNLNTGELQISSLYDVFKGWFLESSPHILTVPETLFVKLQLFLSPHQLEEFLDED